MSRESEGEVELVFLQASPFCNINCDYCYLPDRTATSRMRFDTLRHALQLVRTLGCRGTAWCVVWHVGEPLSVPVEWYREAHRICGEVLDDRPLEIHFQTNGTLLTPAWVDFIKSDPRIQICVSLDGPEWVHDARRKTRRGTGTHAKVVRGVQLLRAAEVPFDCIAVVTDRTLEFPDQLFEFFYELEPRILSISPENVDGAHQSSSLEGSEMEARYRRFLRRIADLYLAEDRRFIARNFIWVERKLKDFQREGEENSVRIDGNRLTRPWRVASVDWSGNVHTFSPSLLNMELAGVGKHLGNVHSVPPAQMIGSEKLQWLSKQIDLGLEKCRTECSHYGHCGGGSPAHKWFEQGSFAVSETRYCRLGVQADWEVYLAAVEERAPP